MTPHSRLTAPVQSQVGLTRTLQILKYMQISLLRAEIFPKDRSRLHTLPIHNNNKYASSRTNHIFVFFELVFVLLLLLYYIFILSYIDTFRIPHESALIFLITETYIYIYHYTTVQCNIQQTVSIGKRINPEKL